MSQQKNLLVVKSSSALSVEQCELLRESLSAGAQRVNAEVLILSGGDVDAEYIPAGLEDLIDAVRQQTQAIGQLANSNAMLAQAIADSYDEGEESAPGQYLDGTSAQ